MKCFYINRCAGDIIYALPAIKAAGGGIIATGLPLELHYALARLLRTQSMVTDVIHESQGLPAGFINLDGFRFHKNINDQHLCKTFADMLGVEADYKNGWLVPMLTFSSQSYACVNVTERYRDTFFKWRSEIEFLKSATELPIHFIGSHDEYQNFRKVYGNAGIIHQPTKTLWDALVTIQCAKYFSGNQSSCLAIAEGLGRSYRFERAPTHDNCALHVSRETILNSNFSRKMHFTGARFKEIISNLKK